MTAKLLEPTYMELDLNKIEDFEDLRAVFLAFNFQWKQITVSTEVINHYPRLNKLLKDTK